MFLLLKIFFSIIIFTISIYFIGKLYNYYADGKIKTNITSTQIFENLIFGLIIFVTIYSIIITGGKTVNILYLCILVFYFLYKRKFKERIITSTNVNNKEIYKQILSCFIVFVILFFMYLLSVYDYKTGMFKKVFFDLEYYAELSQYLNLGYENTAFFENMIAPQNINAYHFFDIWIISLFSKIFSVPSQLSTCIAMPCLLAIVFFWGVLSLIKKNEKSFFDYFFIFVFSVYFILNIFIKFNMFFDVENILFYISRSNLFIYPKLFVSAVFFILFFNKLSEKNYFAALLVLMCLVPASIIYMPVAIGAICCLSAFIIYKFRYGLMSKPQIFFVGSALFVFILLFIIYWFRVQDNIATMGEGMDNSVITFVGYERYIQFFRYPLFHLIAVFPFALCLFIFRKQLFKTIDNLKEILFFICIIFLGAVAIGLLTVSKFDSVQLYSNIVIPLAYIFPIFIISNINFSGTKLVLYRILIIFLIVFCAKYILFSVSAYAKVDIMPSDAVIVKNEIIKNKNKRIYCAYIYSEDFYKESNLHAICNLFKPASYINNITNKFFEVEISNYVAYNVYSGNNIANFMENNEILSRVKSGTFYKYVEQQKTEGIFSSIDESQKQFIEKFGFQYVFIDKRAQIPATLVPILEKISEDDSPDGCVFYKIVN